MTCDLFSFEKMLSDKACILVVDDVVDNVFLLQAVLEAEGYSVETAYDGAIALHKIDKFQPDLVLLDIMMPGLNGYDVTQQVRKNPQYSSLPIILLTAHDEYSQRPYAEIGANDLIRKPVNFDELLNKVESFVSSESISPSNVA